MNEPYWYICTNCGIACPSARGDDAPDEDVEQARDEAPDMVVVVCEACHRDLLHRMAS